MASVNFDAVEVATQVIEAVGTIVSAYASFELLEVARDNFELWNDQRQYYYNTFQNGVEGPLGALIFSRPVEMLDYTGAASTIYYPDTGVLGGEAGNTGAWWDRHSAMYGTTRDPSITELTSDTARIQSDWANYLFRYEEHTTDIHNDIRWDRRMMMHNAGIKQGTAIGSALASSFNVYESAIDSIGDQFATLANGAAAYAGYRRAKADTNDDYNEHSIQRNKPVAVEHNSTFVGPR